ncbi:PREDICTED: serine/threonine-protein kinase OSR1-like [Amphimedon queenslandica]|uniref:non-specific serine/threonine protein kinase n=1 Tax=Amphimedon queenslandica TaxID=400682 RepID=A0A1X7VQS6_AMPQE|nr:PREDICTED: serine/threonine-protein kinase OSR1-like [Amphimedon queenslandica]|eukprot:XP_019857619.1 PREDICTED: serine/threonine-protein kinase OSR1-like [Amphimedon queenslandica]
MARVPEPVVEDKDPPSPPKPVSKTWSNKKEDYELKDVIGSGATAVVQVAVYVPRNEKVAIKRIDLEQYKSSMEELQKEINLMSNCNHPNVINYYTSFVVRHELWLVMKLMSGGSLLDIIKHVMTKGNKGGVLDEPVITTILYHVLQGLEYFHTNGQIHRDLKAGNILIGEDGAVQLADFGVSNWLYGEAGGGKKRNPRYTFVGTPCWMAPEVMDQSVGYDSKADIWSFGITALEMATGTAPYAKFPPMKVLMLTLENPPPTLDTCCELNGEDYRKNYSKAFQKMVEKCLQKDPSKRPSATELLKNPLFKKAKGKEFIKEVVLGNAPSLSSRATKVKRVPGTSGRLHKTEEGGWVWSDEEMTEEYEVEDDNKKTKLANKSTPSSSSGVTTLQASPSSSPAPSSAPSSTSAPTQSQDPGASLTGELQVLMLKMKELQDQITDIRGQEQELMTQQIQNPTLLTTQSHQSKAVQLLNQRQEKEREQQQLIFQQQQIAVKLQQLQISLQNDPQQKQDPSAAKKVLKIALRKRTEQNQLKDIKFDYIIGTDTADAIAKDLLAAGLLEGRELVVVAANISKLIENPSQKVTFQVGNVPQEQLDDKKLIGYAQLYVVNTDK